MVDISVVVWLDAWFEEECSTTKELKTSYPTTQIGTIIEMTEEYVRMASRIFPYDEGFGDITTIPASLVLEVQKIGEFTPGKKRKRR